jgi:hypothetical protein
MVQIPSCPVDPEWDALERKRRLWWHHQPRNEAVAHLAQALAQGNTQELHALGVRLLREERRRARRGWKVMILVESERHAEVLVQLLPGWRVLTATFGKDEQPIREPLRELAGLIVTVLRAHQEGVTADVLVRATGGCDKLLLNGSDRNGLEIAAAVGLVVDFNDDSDTRTKEDSETRTYDYYQQGLTVNGVRKIT